MFFNLMVKRKFRLIFWLLFLGFLLAVYSFYLLPAGGGRGPALTKVRAGIFQKEAAFLFYLADENKFFEKNNINALVKAEQSETAILEKLAIESLDLGLVSDSALARESFKYPTLRVLSVIAEIKIKNYQETASRFFLLVSRQRWLNQNPELAEKLIKSLIEAERLWVEGKRKQVSLTPSCAYRYYVHLPQSLLLQLENQAELIKEEHFLALNTPDYLKLIYPYSLEVIDSLRVSMIR